MAISTDCPTPYGLTVQGAYIRVFSAQSDRVLTRVQLSVYASAEAAQAGAQEMDRRLCVFSTADVDGPLWPALYGLVKALPEYANAVDC